MLRSLTVAAIALPLLAPSQAGCSDLLSAVGQCGGGASGSLGNGSASISAEESSTGPGSGGAQGSGAGWNSTGGAGGGASGPYIPPPRLPGLDRSTDWECIEVVGTARCAWGEVGEWDDAVVEDAADGTEARAVTLADVVSFAPDPGTVSAEPGSVAVVGLPTNLVASTATHTRSGTLLGRAAEVRFTPTAWSWDHGDGTSATHGTAGATWAALGVPEFSETATSHTYAAAGTYSLQLTVAFAAEYRWGSGAWVRIPGTLAIPAASVTLNAAEPRTVLVAADCTEAPDAPGC